MKRIGKIKWLWLLLAIGCTQSEVEEEAVPSHTQERLEATFSLRVLSSHVPVTRSVTFTSGGTFESDTLAVGANDSSAGVAVNDSVQTRAAAGLSEDQENTIGNLWVGQYDASGNRVYNEYFPTVTDPNTISLTLKSDNTGHKNRLYFVANAGDLGAIATEKALKEKTLTCTDDAGLPSGNLCMMRGMWEGEIVGGVKDIPVEMIRLVAKITFAYAINGSDFTFTPTSVVLKNAPVISQVEPTETQLAGMTYREYAGTASNSGARMCWYLPENMAGNGTPSVDSEKKKTGAGITSATCIELHGDAVQLGVSYQNVTFRFYPGSDMNNYDIVRNSHYDMSVTLKGIDLSDERITVGDIPPIEVNPDHIPAEGGEKSVAITTRPGDSWRFTMPDWLTALIGSETAVGGATVSNNKPYMIPFKAAVNPKAEVRTSAIAIAAGAETQTVSISQNASSMSKGGDISLGAAAGSGSSYFKATKGLPWVAAFESASNDWLEWSASNPATSGNALGSDQSLRVQTTVNPSAQARSEKIVVKAGASVEDAGYTGLKQEIAVKQAGSTVTGSTLNNIAARGATGNASFSATAGLAWASSITSGNWITLNSGGSGTSTTGSAQTINYTAAINPSSSARQGTIRVRAGDVTTGPTGDIVLNQLGSTLSVSGAKTIAATASTGNTSTFNATAGLSWNVGVTSTGSWLSLTGTTSGTNNTTGANQTITYRAVVNPNASTRQGTITVKAGNAVSGTDAGLTKTIAVTQSASSLSATISPTTLAVTAGAGGTYTLNATSGLSYSFTIGFPSWLTVTNGTASTGGGTTTGSNQTLTYKTGSVNPNASERKATVRVKAGNMTRDVEIRQAASTFDRTNPTGKIASAANSTVTGSVTATAGLAWTITPTTNNNITVSPTSGNGNATITFKGAANTGAERTGSFTLSATGASPARTLAFSVTQEKYEAPAITGNMQVCKTVFGPMNKWGADTVCKDLTAEGKSDWYLPALAQMQDIYQNKSSLEAIEGFAPFPTPGYWTSSPAPQGLTWVINITNGSTGKTGENNNLYVRCVRDK